MSRHIGIVACSSEGAALCYRTICLEGAEVLGRHAHPEVTMHTYPLSEYMRYIEPGDWDGVAGLMISSAEKLAGAGADFLICPDNTIHEAFDRVAARTSLPWLHIAQEVAKVARSNDYRRLAVLGTRYLMEGPVYPPKLDALGLAHQTPGPADRERVDRIIFDELVNGVITQESRDYFTALIARMEADGCDAVVLGCTEIPLIVTPAVSSLPTLDSARILARAALQEATQA